jgi:hypothetical protein
VPLAACDAVGTPSVGALVTLPAPATPSAVSPGFLTLLRGGDSEDGAVVRVYWHVTCAGAVPLVRALTSRLGGAGVPFRLKVADHPLRFDRADAAVLYLPGAAFAAVRGDLAAVASELRPCLRPQPPVFTLPLAPGVGLAEQRADTAESFGQARCTLLAEGLVEARERRMRAGARLRVVAERFARAGLTLEAPYREPALAGRHVL